MGEETTLDLLVFNLGNRAFGLDAAHIGGVIELKPVTPIPKAPRHVLGVFNLRGNVVPLIDLSRLLGFEPQAGGEKAVIVTEIKSRSAEQSVGFLVDQVQKMISFAEIMQPPAAGTGMDKHYVKGIVSLGAGFVFVLSSEDLLLPEVLFTSPAQRKKPAESAREEASDE